MAKSVGEDWQNGGCRDELMGIRLWTDSSYEDLSNKRAQRPSIHWAAPERTTDHGLKHLTIHSLSEEREHGRHSVALLIMRHSESIPVQLAAMHHVHKPLFWPSLTLLWCHTDDLHNTQDQLWFMSRH